MQKAAEVGYFGVIKKLDLSRQAPSSITDYLRYACFYSESFLKKRSDARLNFSQSIAHTLKSALLGNESFITQAINNVSGGEFGLAERNETTKVLHTLAARHRETLERIGHVLSFYTRLRLNYGNACLLEEIEDLVGTRPERHLIKVVSTPGDFRGYFDRVMIKLAIENLIDNSLKAVRGIEGREPQIEIRSGLICEPGGTFMFEVKVVDNGVGLKAGTEAEVNVPFFTADNLEKGIASFGIGCAETEKIAMLHRSGPTIGDLTVANRTDKRGCVATLRFPRYSTPVAK
jgi:signal transduction histidine kinase